MEINIGIEFRSSSPALYLTSQQLLSSKTTQTQYVQNQTHDLCTPFPIFHCPMSQRVAAPTIQLWRPIIHGYSLCLSSLLSHILTVTNSYPLYLLNNSQIFFIFPIIFLVQATISSSLIRSCNAFIALQKIKHLLYAFYKLFSILIAHWSFLSKTLTISSLNLLKCNQNFLCSSFIALITVAILLYLYVYLIIHFLFQATLSSVRHLPSTVSPEAHIMPCTEPVITIY